MLGFPISTTSITKDRPFIVFEEQMTELRFGLDLGQAQTNKMIDDLSWMDFGTEEGDYLELLSSVEITEAASGQADPTTYIYSFSHGGKVARALSQRPFRMTVDLNSFMGELISY